VVEPARVLVVTTGTELVSARQQEPVTDATNVAGAASDDDATHDGSTAVPLSDAAAPARIRDANAISLTMALVEVGATAMHCSITDTPGALLDVVSAAASTADLVITTGGISMGAFEVVKQALAAPTGGQAWFGKVALQPGGPQGLGTVAGLPFVALPGNPVSALVSFELFVRPVLARAHGGPPQRRRHMAPLAGPLDSRRGIRQLRWGSIDIDGRVHVDRAGSHLLVHFARASVLVIVPENVVHLAAGDQVECWEIP
jgi:molybdopterin molybdotransferase